jgi:acyl carrier protein
VTRAEALAVLETALDAPPGSITEETELDSVKGWDSVGQLSVMAAYDAGVGVVLPPPKIASCRTAAELLELIKEKLE